MTDLVTNSAHSIRVLSAHLTQVQGLVASIDPISVERIVARIAEIREASGVLYTAGNGGSAANASHCAMHLRECGVKSFSLIDSSSHLTAASNDFGYEESLVKGLPGGLLEASDMVMVFSCSGNSPNVLKLLELARMQGCPTIGILGFGGGLAASLCTDYVALDSEDYEAIEDAHSAIIHALRKVFSPGRP